MTYATDIGLPFGLYLGGKFLSIGASDWKDHYAKNAEDIRTVGGINRRSYPYKDQYQPNVIDTFAFELDFRGIQTQDDMSALQYLRAVGGNIDVCQFKRTTEVWKRDTAFTTVKTMRRLAMRTITSPPTGSVAALPEIATSAGSVITEGVGAGHYVVGSADEFGRTTITLGTATTEFVFEYVPLMYMYDASFSVSMPEKFIEGWVMTLVEAV